MPIERLKFMAKSKSKEAKLTSVQVRMDEDMREAVDQLAARKKWSRTNAAVQLILWALSASKGGKTI